jgi:hypothetical protein
MEYRRRSYGTQFAQKWCPDCPGTMMGKPGGYGMMNVVPANDSPADGRAVDAFERTIGKTKRRKEVGRAGKKQYHIVRNLGKRLYFFKKNINTRQ